MTMSGFASGLAAVTLAGVTTKIAGIPKTLNGVTLPAMWVDLPTAVIEPSGEFSTLAASAARYTTTIYIAVDAVVEGLPDTQRTAMLQVADAVEAWAEASPYAVEIRLTPRIPVGSIEYRGVTVLVSGEDME